MRGQLITSTHGLLDVEIASSPCVYNDKPAVVVLARDITAQLRYERDLHALADAVVIVAWTGAEIVSRNDSGPSVSTSSRSGTWTCVRNDPALIVAVLLVAV